MYFILSTAESVPHAPHLRVYPPQCSHIGRAPPRSRFHDRAPEAARASPPARAEIRETSPTAAKFAADTHICPGALKTEMPPTARKPGVRRHREYTESYAAKNITLVRLH